MNPPRQSDKILRLSTPLTLTGISLRRRRAKDEAFLAALFASVRRPMVAGWPKMRQEAFLREQFALQTRHYDQSYPDLWPGIIERNGIPVGRLSLWRQPEEIRVVDLALLPEARAQGLGGELLRCVQAEAVHHRQRVCLHVDLANPALRLYRRLGFRPEGAQTFPDQLMVWSGEGEVTSSVGTESGTGTERAGSDSASPGSDRPELG